MNKQLQLLTILLLLVFQQITAQKSIISLDDLNPDIVWQLKPQASENASAAQISLPGFKMNDALKAVVPGVVFTSYVEAGIEKDPNYADNIYRVDESFYNRPFWYRTEFKIPDSYKKGQKIWLHFDNTNRFADFYLNGKKISGSEQSVKDVSGHMMRSAFDITNLINVNGENALAVLIWDADQKKLRNAKDPFGVVCSPSYLAAAGWDWMPYVPGRLAGITGNVYLRFSGDVIMEDPWVRSDLPNLNTAEISIKPNIRNVSDKPQDVIITGEIQPGNIKFSKTIRIESGKSSEITLSKADFSQLIIQQPKLWWPNGYGNPDLYTCSLKCMVGNTESDSKTITFGIRKYDYKFIDNKAGMPVLTFYINGRKIFLKGGNWGMSEYLLRCRNEEYETKIRLHKDMNYNMIRLWTGCVTDDAFYDYCDKYGIMVWDDFWLYVAYNDVAQPEAFKTNALDKVKRLRNHPSIAIWCGANETHPKPELDNYLREMIAKVDMNDRMYKSSSNQDGLSGSGWWGNQPPRHHFETSGSNLAFNDPPYPYSSDYGYGLRTEIGTATFPNYESVIKFIPQENHWPLPTDEQLKNDDNNVWNKHFFGKEASNASPINYKKAVNEQFGESENLQEFCEKAQLINLEVMKGMYEAWNDKMWNDATGLLIWMSQSAYPSFVWQTYDYYYDATGAYQGAKMACEPTHIQWNSSSSSIKVINNTINALTNVEATAKVYNIKGKELRQFRKSMTLDVESANINEAFILNLNRENLALGKNITASSATQHMPTKLATDGGAGSRWESEYSDPQWIYVDLGKKEIIENVVIKWEAAHAREYELQTSNDAQHWTTVHKQTDSKGGSEQIGLNRTKARYVRINCISRATQFGYSIFEIEVYGKSQKKNALTPVHFIKLELKDKNKKLLSENFYWRNGIEDLNYNDLNNVSEANITAELAERKNTDGKEIITFSINNKSKNVAFANRLTLINKATGEQILPAIFSENYLTLLPGEQKKISVEFDAQPNTNEVEIVSKQFRKTEKVLLKTQL